MCAISIAAFPAFAKDADALSKESIQAALDSAYAQFKDLKEGKNADYILRARQGRSEHLRCCARDHGRPRLHQGRCRLGSLDPVDLQGLHDGQGHRGTGLEAIANNMGVDATGQVFNSIYAVEQNKGSEMNAMVNPGAITATGMVSGSSRQEIWNKI